MSAWERIQTRAKQPGRDFFDMLVDPASIQTQLLKNILKKNARSRTGKLREFNTITSIKDFQQRNPIICYDDLQKDIGLIQAGVQNILTQEPIVAFEETGGSSGGSKLIPFTATGLGAIQNAVIPWLHNLLTHRPGIATGTAYWSISPATRSPRLESGGIPIGLSSDAAYFGPEFGQDILDTLAVPVEVGAIENFADWRRQTLRYLLSRKDLTFISVWSPTFLLDLVKAIPEELDRIFDGVSANHVPSSSCHALPIFSKDRIREIQSAVQGNSIDTKTLWPMLDTISCWLDANSARYRDELASMFSGVYLQGKGLLATEGVVSIPVCKEDAEEGSVLAINSGFFEFVDEDDRVFLAHELKLSNTYRVVITTFSGLYRYDLGDQVIVSGFLEATPLIKFCGRSGLVSDLCGEKLTEAFVLKQLSRLPGSAMLSPCISSKAGYVIFLDAKHFGLSSAKSVTEEVEQGLCSNPQYAYATRIGQLDRLSYCRVDNLWEQYIGYQRSCGRLIGDVKPPVLSLDTALFNALSKARAAA